MEGRLTPGFRAQRHRLLGDARRLAIVEALGEGPRQIPELSRLLGIHPTTVRAHLDKLLEAGVLEEAPGIPAGRGRPSKRYRLREPLLAGDPELRLFVGSLVRLLRRAYGDQAVAAALEEGLNRGHQSGRSFRHPSPEQTAQEIIGLLERLSFALAPPLRRNGGFSIDIRHCPFQVDPPVTPTAPSSAPSTRVSSVAWPRSPPGTRSPCACCPSWGPTCADSSCVSPTKCWREPATEAPRRPQNRTP